MSTLLVFAIKSAIVLTLLLLPGILLLFRQKMFRFNRLTLLAILLLSLTLPLFNFSRLSMDDVPAVQRFEQGLAEAGIPVGNTAFLPQEVASPSPFPWFYIISILYVIGVTIILGIRLYEALSMRCIIRQGSIWTKDEPDGIRIFCHADNVAPFSWLHSIVIGEQDYHESGHEIILHEKAHILYHHSADILLLTVVEAIQWWNPVVYLLGMYLRDVHEYEADDYVLRQGISCHAYSELIIRKAVGAGSYTFANQFNHSLTKKRIAMMIKREPQSWMRSRVLYVIPVAALALSAFATPEFQTASDLIEDTVNSSNPYTAKDFTVKGKVADGIDISRLLVYTWDYAGQQGMPAPRDTVEVKNGEFMFSVSLAEPYSGMLSAIHPDGTTGKFFQEFMFVPGETCRMSIYGENLGEFRISGSRFYREWGHFAEFYQSLKDKLTQDNDDDAFFTALKDYNDEHANEEGSILYQYMWLGGILDFHIADGIQEGRFKKYILHRKKQYGKSSDGVWQE